MSEKYNPDKIPILVGLYITSAYWFTSSTSFANPAVTIARTLSDTFSGINYGDTFPFIFCQFVGGLLALFLFKIISSNKIEYTTYVYQYRHHPKCVSRSPNRFFLMVF